MASYDYDLFVIGAGSGGVRASRIAAGFGARVAVAESSRVGGTCVIRGCIPKKLLIYGAHYRNDFEDAASYGWTSNVPQFDWPTLIAAKNKETARLEGIYRTLITNPGGKIIEGRATITGPHEVAVEGKRYTAGTILVATGGYPTAPEIPGIETVGTSDDALDLPSLPRRVVIVGGGYIAVEFAGIFAGFGSEVTLVIRGEELLNGFDDDIRVALAQAMRTQGITILDRCNISRIEHSDAGYTLWTDRGGEIDADFVLYATGRAPNTKGLGLEEVGVKLDDKGAIVVDEYSRTSVPSIWAVGDVTDRLALTPVALREGHAFAETVFNDNPSKANHDNVPTAVFSDPPIGTVGLTETQARKRYGNVDIYKSKFRPLKHTLTGRAEQTLMKLIVDPATDKVVGAHMLGADAPEILQGIGIAVVAGATKKQFDATVGIHPSAAEEFVTMRTKEKPVAAKAAE